MAKRFTLVQSGSCRGIQLRSFILLEEFCGMLDSRRERVGFGWCLNRPSSRRPALVKEQARPLCRTASACGETPHNYAITFSKSPVMISAASAIIPKSKAIAKRPPLRELFRGAFERLHTMVCAHSSPCRCCCTVFCIAE